MSTQAETAPNPSRALLKQMLSERNQEPTRVEAVDEQIRRTFERTVAVMVLDMVGFTKLSRDCGIIHYLAMIEQMNLVAGPAVVGNGGHVFKQEADNLFATFETPAHALEAALDIFRGFEAINGVVPSNRDIVGSVGIGYGPVLVIGEEDVFGCELNAASKLGEDIAGASEILLTADAHAALPPDRYRCQVTNHAIGGLDHDCYLFKAKLFGGREVPAQVGHPRTEGE